ncbi:MAG: histidinol dehydrogenase [Brevinematia bacterium]
MKVTNIYGQIFDSIRVRGAEIFSDKKLIKTVEKIIDDVVRYGDKAVLKYTRKFDGTPKGFSVMVSDEEIKESIEIVEGSRELIDVANSFLKASDRIYKFHKAQLEYFNLRDKWFIQTNGIVGQVVKPVGSVCVYVPGGRAVYPSTLIMNVIPAKVAGVDKIYVSTPSRNGKVSPILIYLSNKLGVNGIYKVGGAVSVASFAFGTQSIPKVDMIVGPGNKYFVAAKKVLSGVVGIDMLPGPSEIAVVADHGNPYYIALDLLSQLEHDPDSSGYFISIDENLISSVKDNIRSIVNRIDKWVLKSSMNNLLFILAKGVEECFEIVNMISPEHLEVIVKGIDINNIDRFVRNAGTVLIGESTPVVLADYIAGTNHVLPTGKTARFSSPLGVYNFVKFYNVVQWSSENLEYDKNDILRLAKYENLEVHALSVEKRSN